MNAPARIIPERHRRRLVGVVALLDSDRDGEILAAAAATKRLLQPHRMALAEIVASALSTPKRIVAPEPVPPGRNWQRLARWCLLCPAINAWEKEFLASVIQQNWPLSPKQSDKLAAIAAKAGVE